LGTKQVLSKFLNFSKPLKNKGLISGLLSLMLSSISGFNVGRGKLNASKPGKKRRMLSATSCPG